MPDGSKLAALMATSYPYRWISSNFDLPYWVVLAYWQPDATGKAAREIVNSMFDLDQALLLRYIHIAETKARSNQLP